MTPSLRIPVALRLSRACLVALGLALAARTSAETTWPQIGSVTPRTAAEIRSSPWSIGGETLDRGFAEYANYKAYVGPLGAKSIRFQAGWARCERQPGVYDWAWLDAAVDDARAQGVQPWLELSYGNPIYPGGGNLGLGDGIPTSPEALAAWDNWARALVRRYRDRVSEWQIWNEPDHGREKPSVPVEAYAAFYIRTAEIVREEQPRSRLYALALASQRRPYAGQFLAALQQRGKLGLVDAITFHGYPKNPDDMAFADELEATISRYSASIALRQGETGAPSTAATSGALPGHPWTELTQAKWNLRRMLAHRARDLPFNLFTLMDFNYTSGRARGLNSKGLLKANPDLTVAYPKPAYAAAQHVFSIFDDDLRRLPDIAPTSTASRAIAFSAYRASPSGAPVVAAWFRDAAPSDSNATTTVDLTVSGLEFATPVYVDLRTGAVHRIPAEAMKRVDGNMTFAAVALYDSPVLIAEKNAFRWTPTTTP